jgi:hypothetical protein
MSPGRNQSESLFSIVAKFVQHLSLSLSPRLLGFLLMLFEN